MLYQKMLLGATPYFATITRLDYFEMHSHIECELLYCLDGKAEIKLGSCSYSFNSGDFALINSMTPHEIIGGDQNCRVVLLEIGPALLKSGFKSLSSLNLPSPIVELSKGEEDNKISQAFRELSELLLVRESNELLIISAIYKVCGLICQKFNDKAYQTTSFGVSAATPHIEKALQLIYREYSRQLTVDDAAFVSGYGKSNFCKIFKSVYGDSFHKILNRYRIENACYLLAETELSVSEIAERVGFMDIKTFYRVFKQTTGRTPCEFKGGI